MLRTRPRLAAAIVAALGLALGACEVDADPDRADPVPAAPADATGPAPASESPAPTLDAGEVGTADATPASFTVPWLEAEIVLPAPWRLVSAGVGRTVLEHPSAAGPGRGISVMLELRDGAAATAAAGEEQVALLSSGESGSRVTLPGGLLLTSDSGVNISVLPGDTGLAPEEAARLVEESLEVVLGLLRTIDPPAAQPAPAGGRPGGADASVPPERPAATGPRLPVVRTSFGAPFPDDLPIAMIPGPTLAEVSDVDRAGGTRICYDRSGQQIDCADRCVDRPESVSLEQCQEMLARSDALLASSFWMKPTRTWTYRMPSGTDQDIRATCISFRDRLRESGGTTDDAYYLSDRHCELDVAHGFRMASIGGFLPDGSRLDARVRDHDPLLEDLGVCSRPCPSIAVGLTFP